MFRVSLITSPSVIRCHFQMVYMMFWIDSLVNIERSD